MNLESFVAIPNVAYLGAAVLFILSLGGLSNQETARRGNAYGLVGMVIAIVATILLLLVPDTHGNIREISSANWSLLIGAAVIGGAIGAMMAKRVAMTAMPQLVALLHSFVGLAAVLVGISTWLTADLSQHGSDLIHLLEIWFGVAIGAITFTGSIVAWAKLRGWLFGKRVPGAPLLLPGRHALNALITLACIGMAVPFIADTKDSAEPAIELGEELADVESAIDRIQEEKTQDDISPMTLKTLEKAEKAAQEKASEIQAELTPIQNPKPQGTGFLVLLVMTGLTCLLGVHLVLAIGGADMPVVVSLLNSYSGWAAAAAGFMLANDLLLVTGALVGSSGAILSYIMCKAMNRSIWNVVFGGFGTDGGKPSASSAPIEGEVTVTDIDEVAELARDAKSIIIVPGYGMAVARAQHLVNEFSSMMRKKGCNVRYAIHPVAGRLPGHMNVLLAEAGVPYDIVLEMDEINDDCPDTDLVLVIGANDVVNPGAETDEASPIYGMPVIQVWKAGTTIVLKRSLGAGYAGVGNPLFYKENNKMLLGDAKDSMGKLMALLT
jgi:NAD(P) transhydrogenase subunit beta